MLALTTPRSQGQGASIAFEIKCKSDKCRIATQHPTPPVPSLFRTHPIMNFSPGANENRFRAITLKT
jgi:hypothetical protein